MPLWSTTPIKQECQITLLLSYLIHIIEKKNMDKLGASVSRAEQSVFNTPKIHPN